MAFTKIKVTLPTCILVLISVILSIMAINNFKIDINNHNGLLVEEMCGMGRNCGCDKRGGSGRPFFLMEGMHNNKDHKIEGMHHEVEEEEEDVKTEDLASVSAFTSSLLN